MKIKEKTKKQVDQEKINFKFRKESVKNKTGYLNLFDNFNADLDENKLPNPLLFWKHQDCSSMKTLALCNFNVSAITAMVERAFSAHKLHLTSLRTSLKDNTNGGLYLRQPQNC